MMTQTHIQEERRLSLILRRVLALKKDELMSDAQSLIEEHFSNITKNNCLKSNQLKNLEGVAFTATNVGEVFKFIDKQSNKEKDNSSKEKSNSQQKWKHKDLNKNLKDRINKIIGQPPGKTTGEAGAKDEVLTEVKRKAQQSPAVSAAIMNEWFSTVRELEVQMELLRDFLSYFTTFYALKASEIPGAQEEED